MRALELDLKEGVDMVEHAAHAALAALLVVRGIHVLCAVPGCTPVARVLTHFFYPITVACECVTVTDRVRCLMPAARPATAAC